MKKTIITGLIGISAISGLITSSSVIYANTTDSEKISNSQNFAENMNDFQFTKGTYYSKYIIDGSFKANNTINGKISEQTTKIEFEVNNIAAANEINYWGIFGVYKGSAEPEGVEIIFDAIKTSEDTYKMTITVDKGWFRKHMYYNNKVRIYCIDNPIDNNQYEVMNINLDQLAEIG